MIQHLGVIILAYVLDRFIGDPPDWPHPVKAFGKMIAFLDTHWNRGRYPRFMGVIMVIILLGMVLGVGLGLVILSYRLHPVAGFGLEAVLIATTISHKGLQKAACDVAGPLQHHDLKTARENVSWIVGRDTENLNESGIVRGAVETVAENTSDGITAPLFWAFIGGAPLALVYKLINTCDSMVGYTDDQYRAFGWASARLDDLVNWIPSRLTGMVMMLVKKPEHMTRRDAWATLLRDAKKHPSPNSGWGEAAMASLLGVRLGGLNSYGGRTSHRAEMGEAFITLDKEHINQSIVIMERTVLLFLVFIVLGGLTIASAITWI